MTTPLFRRMLDIDIDQKNVYLTYTVYSVDGNHMSINAYKYTMSYAKRGLAIAINPATGNAGRYTQLNYRIQEAAKDKKKPALDEATVKLAIDILNYA